MKQVSNDYKNNIKRMGRQLDSIITYTIDEEETVLGKEDLNSVNPHYQSALLKSAMKQLDIDSNVEIPVGTEINYQFGVKVGNSYEYIDYGNYIVKEVEKQEDTRSWLIKCCDKMLYSMKPYESVGVTFPTTIRDYLTALCTKIGLTFANENDEFVNYDKPIQSEPYLDSEGGSLEYTYRDVFDEMAQVTASVICINNDDEVEIRYVNDTEGENLCPPFEKWTLINGAFIDSNGDLNIPLNSTAIAYIDWKKRSNQLHVYYYLSDGGCHYFQTQYKDENGNNLNPSGNGNANNDEANNVMSRAGFGGNNTYGTSISNAQTISLTLRSITQWAPNGYKMRYVMVTDHLLQTNPPFIPYGNVIDEEYLKDVNVNFGEKYGPINSVVFTRSGGSDSIYEKDDASIEANGLCEVKIEDNQILNGNNRDEFMPQIFAKLNGLEYYINDYDSTGITFYELMDRYNVKVGDKYYSCIMFNDDVMVTQGLEESVNADRLEKSQTDYTKADKTDRRIKQAYIIVDKQNQRIDSVVQTVSTLSDMVDSQGNDIDALGTRITQTIGSITANVTAIQDTLENGVSLVKTLIVTINDEGLSVATDTSRTSTIMTADKFSVRSGGKDLAFLGYDEETNSTKAQMDNLTVTNYFIAGHHRIEKFERNGEKRTGHFYIGG